MNARQLGTKLSHQESKGIEQNGMESNVKQVCTHAFIVSDKVHIVTIITSHLSGVNILIGIDLWFMSIPESVHKIIIDTYRITQDYTQDYNWHIQNYDKHLC